MDIEWFTNGRVGFLLKDNICTVSSRGLYFMCDAVKAYKLLDYKFVYVGKNKENKNIVAKFTNVENKFATAYSISASNKQRVNSNRGAFVTIKNFFEKFYNFTDRRIRRYIKDIVENKKCILLEIEVLEGDIKK